MKPGFVYIVTNKREGVLYIGVTDNLSNRIEQHRVGQGASFTRRYNCRRLVWFERFENLHDARKVDRQMKAWQRAWKIEKFETLNPEWNDLVVQLHIL